MLLALGCAAGCATRADLIAVQRDQRETRALLADQQVAIEGLRRRLEIMRTEAGQRPGGRRAAAPAPSSDVLARIDTLEARVAALEQAHLETPPPAAAPAAAPTTPAHVLEAPPTPLPTKALSPQEAAISKEEQAAADERGGSAYRDALELVRQGQCDNAVPKLRDFIRSNPKSDLDDNAQYWIGSCYYGQRDYNHAIIELNEVLLKYPNGDKVPAALLMLADAFADSGDKIDARLILQKLISDHPRSEEAARGREKLKSLGE